MLRMKKGLKLIVLTMLSVFVLGACSSISNSTLPSKEGKKTKWEVSKKAPIFVDEDKKQVKIYATVNGEAEFRGNPDILPEDGTPVVLTYSFGE